MSNSLGLFVSALKRQRQEHLAAPDRESGMQQGRDHYVGLLHIRKRIRHPKGVAADARLN